MLVEGEPLRAAARVAHLFLIAYLLVVFFRMVTGIVIASPGIPMPAIQSLPSYGQGCYEQVALSALEKRMDEHISGQAKYEARFATLETNLTNIHEQLSENNWWLRGIGIAVILAITERYLKFKRRDPPEAPEPDPADSDSQE